MVVVVVVVAMFRPMTCSLFLQTTSAIKTNRKIHAMNRNLQVIAETIVILPGKSKNYTRQKYFD